MTKQIDKKTIDQEKESKSIINKTDESVRNEGIVIPDNSDLTHLSPDEHSDTLDQSKEQMASEPEMAKMTRQKKTNKPVNYWLVVAGLFLVLSVGLFVANPIYQYTKTAQIKSQLKEVRLEKLTPIAQKQTETQEIDLSNKEIYIGKLAIPAVNLHLPIVKGTGEDNLFRGAATNTTNQMLGKGNYSLSSHKMPYDEELLFSPLLRVKKDDMVYLTDGESVYSYQVNKVFVVRPDQVEILDVIPNKQIVTLYTCETDAGEERHVVQGELTGVTRLELTDSKIVDLLNE